MSSIYLSKILVVLTSHSILGSTGKPTGWYLPEVAHPVRAFQKAGFEVHYVSPQGGAAPVDPGSLNGADPQSLAFIQDPIEQSRLSKTLRPEEVDPSKYRAIFFAGGHGTVWDFPQDQGLQKLTREIFESGGVVSAVCHGPAALVNVVLSNGEYLVSGKALTSFTNSEEAAVGLSEVVPLLLETKFRSLGAHFKGAPNWGENVVTDGNLVTGQNPASATAVANEVIRVLRNK